jgi:hypothetical protein
VHDPSSSKKYGALCVGETDADALVTVGDAEGVNDALSEADSDAEIVFDAVLVAVMESTYRLQTHWRTSLQGTSVTSSLKYIAVSRYR